jgi:ABC-2 type transport system ATP-binding protein
MPMRIEFKNLGKRYGSLAALEDIKLRVESGSVLALLGPNGAGKSTLFGCLLGFVRPSAGGFSIDGGEGVCAKLTIGYMPERIVLYPQSTVRENGLFFAQLKQQPAPELERQLKRVGLYDVQERPAGQLSKGMLQRLGLAIALCGNPELLILDEPFNGLDPALLESLQTILAEERQRGATLLVSTHTMSAVEPLATHVAVLLAGRLVAHGTLDALREQYNERSLEKVYHRIAVQGVERGVREQDHEKLRPACDSETLRLGAVQEAIP